jgi:4-oxalocrotonate tautomerase
MPTINVEMLEGRTEVQKRELIERVTEAVCASLGVEAESVNIRIWELRRDSTARGGRLFSERQDTSPPL